MTRYTPYRHGGYESFYVHDPKRRHIHKASVRDRLLHHAVYRVLYPFFDSIFITDSYSCRLDKGTHKSLNKFQAYARQVSHNHTRPCWILKCDIRKFFASIDHETLLRILRASIPDNNIMWLLANIIHSFRTNPDQAVGLPIGNLTSQLFGNVFMNQLDQWVKHYLKAKHYIRYADDFVILSRDKEWLANIISIIRRFLETELKLTLHPDKIILKTAATGVDFLGWIHFPDHRVLRRTTKRRMMRRIQWPTTNETLQSYLGLIKHGNTHKLQQELRNQYWLLGNANLC